MRLPTLLLIAVFAVTAAGVGWIVDRPRVKEHLLRLHQSSNLWIAQAAREVMQKRPPDRK
jgi:hypothetical protein